MGPNNFEETFFLDQSLEAGSTDFLLRGLAPIVLRVFFDLSGVIDRGEIRRGLVKTEVGGWKLKKGLLYSSYTIDIVD